MGYTFANISRQHAAERPEAPALSCNDTTLTYRELEERSNRLANALRTFGIGRGDRFCLLARNSTVFYEALIAASKIGAVLVALNWRLAAREIELIARDSGSELYFSDAEFQDKLEGVGVEVRLLGAEYENLLAGEPTTDPGVDEPIGSDPILQLYSSGTTGLPKGILITNDNLSQTPRSARDLFSMSERSVNMVVSPLFHIGGIGYGSHGLSIGGHTVIAKAADAETLYGLIAKWSVTHTFLVPSMVQSLLESPLLDIADHSSLEYIAFGGAPMNDALLRRVYEQLGCGLISVYGMTETSGTVVGLPPDPSQSEAERLRVLRSCGKPLPWMGEIGIFDPATGNPSATGEVGEVWVRSQQVTPGYWNRPDATDEVLRPDGWFRTGDAAIADADGYYYLQDRLKDMIISGGENVFPAEVESVLCELPDILEVAVIGVPSQRWGETVKAVTVLRDGSTLSEAEIIEYARDNLAHYKCPTSVDFVSELPHNGSGKVVKPELRERYRATAGARS